MARSQMVPRKVLPWPEYRLGTKGPVFAHDFVITIDFRTFYDKWTQLVALFRSTILYMGNNFCDFLFTLLYTKSLPKSDLLYKERICFHQEQIPLRKHAYSNY